MTKKAAVMLVIKDGLILSVSRKKSQNKYGLLGGRVELNETSYEAAIRESKEEAGIIVTKAIFLYTRFYASEYPGAECFDADVYYAIDWFGDPIDSDEGAVKWLTVADLTSAELAAFPEYSKRTFELFREKFPDVYLKF